MTNMMVESNFVPKYLIITLFAILFGAFWAVLNLYNYYPVLKMWIDRLLSQKFHRATLSLDEDMNHLPELDVYIPAYKEGEVIDQSIESVNNTNYPNVSLYILVEPDDDDTRGRLTELKSQFDFTEIVVPLDYPGDSNKPRALNYAFEQTTGEICGVLDAENIVEPDFFTKIASALTTGEKDYAQGMVDMINEDDGWLNTLFRAEYGYWYQIIFPSFVWTRFPLPLSGTSCFFWRSVLEDVSSYRYQENRTPWGQEAKEWFSTHDLTGHCPWDQRNVTEDFELGLHLWIQDYKFALVDSVITEESPLEVDNWIRQRTRWQKGKIYTFSQYVRNPPSNPKQALHVIWQSFLPHLGPVNIAGIVILLIFSYAVGYTLTPIVDSVLTASFAFFLIGLLSHAYGYWKVSDHPPHIKLGRAVMILFTLPLYWLLHWGADLRALKQTYLGQFHWEKTTHTGRNSTLTSGGTINDIDYSARVKQYASEIKLVGVVATVGTVLYSHSVLEMSLWIDEAYTLSVRGSMPISSLINVQSDPHPPVYYILTHIWMNIFGEPLISARIISVIASVLSIFAMYQLGRALYNHRTGIFASALLTFSTFQVHYAQVARMYALFSLFTILSTYCFVRMLQTKTTRSVTLYIIVTLVMIYTHLFAGFVVVAQSLFIHYSYFIPGKNADLSIPSLSQWWGVKIIIFAASLPWLVLKLPAYLPWLGTGSQAQRINWITEPDISVFFDTVLFYMGYPDIYPVLAGNPITRRLSIAISTIVGIVIGIMILKRIRIRMRHGQSELVERKTHFAVFIVLSMTVLPYLVSHIVTPLYVIRYTIPGGILFYVVVSHGIEEIDTTVIQYLVIGVLLLGMMGNLAVYSQGESIEQWEEASAWVEENGDSDDLVLMNPYWIDNAFLYYYDNPSAAIAQYPGSDSTPSEGDPDRLRALVTNNETVMIVSWGYGSKESIRSVLRETHSLENRKRFGVIEVYKYEQREDSQKK